VGKAEDAERLPVTRRDPAHRDRPHRPRIRSANRGSRLSLPADRRLRSDLLTLKKYCIFQTCLFELPPIEMRENRSELPIKTGG
jgi:hypothetical protein